MEKNENIMSYTATELQEMRKNGLDETNWERFHAITDEELEQIIAEDPDEDLDIDWSSARVVIPVKKQQLTLRIDSDIIEFFRNQGKGYQTLMNNVLRSYMRAQQTT
ncbi:MAG: BrnA antitoxin family protein [Chloroflexota bacterium]